MATRLHIAITEAVARWQKAYHLEDYTIVVQKDSELDSFVAAQVTTDSEYLHALLRYNPNCMKECDVDEVISHELAHVFLGELADLVEAAFEHLPEEVKEFNYEVYRQVTERTTERLAKLMRANGH